MPSARREQNHRHMTTKTNGMGCLIRIPMRRTLIPVLNT